MRAIRKELVFLIMVLVMACSAVCWAQEDATNAFLAKNYGWYFDKPSSLVCDSNTDALPGGKTAFWNSVCRQKDPSYFTVVLWRLPSVNSAVNEKTVYNYMAGENGYKKVECTNSDVAGLGTIKDCSVSLPNGTFYVSFFHFEAKVPMPYVVETKDGPKESDVLNFTIYVRNASPHGSTSRVKDKLRELINSMKFVTK